LIPSFDIWGLSADTFVEPWRSAILADAFANVIQQNLNESIVFKTIKYWPIHCLGNWFNQFIDWSSDSITTKEAAIEDEPLMRLAHQVVIDETNLVWYQQYQHR
jgi:hypothetical protein